MPGGMVTTVSDSPITLEEDGAHEGVSPSLGMKMWASAGREQLPDGARRSIPELEAAIRQVPLPDSGERLFDPSSKVTDDDYDRAAMCLAHCYLVLLEGTNPPALESEQVYTDQEVHDLIIDRHPEWSAAEKQDALDVLVGEPKGKDTELFDAVKNRWPNYAEYFGGVSGFQAGYAFNAVRAIHGLGVEPNPAFMSVITDDED